MKVYHIKCTTFAAISSIDPAPVPQQWCIFFLWNFAPLEEINEYQGLRIPGYSISWPYTTETINAAGTSCRQHISISIG